MNISLETIDLLRKRANVSYEEAKIALENNNGDPVEALIFLEKQNKTKDNKKSSTDGGLHTIANRVKTLIKKGNETRLIIGKQENPVLNLPLTIAVIGSIAAPVIPLIGIPLAFITKHRIRVEKLNGEDLKINEVLDKVASTVDSVVDQVNKEKNSEEE